MHIKEALGTCNQSKGKKAEKFQLNSSMWNLLVTLRILFLNYDNCIFKFFIYATLQFFFFFSNLRIRKMTEFITFKMMVRGHIQHDLDVKNDLVLTGR